MKPLPQKLGRSSNLVGRKFGRLTVIQYLPNRKHHNRVWLCKCECGNEYEVTTTLLANGGVRSCGCLQKEHWKTTPITHGMSGTRIFHSFYGAKSRCENINNPKYKNYGARGIKMEWKSFEDFLADMYDSYKRHSKKYGEQNTTLERINVDGNYCKENCRWATWDEQARNKTNKLVMNFLGKETRLTEVSKITGISYHALYRSRVRELMKDPDFITTIKERLS